MAKFISYFDTLIEVLETCDSDKLPYQMARNIPTLLAYFHSARNKDYDGNLAVIVISEGLKIEKVKTY